MFTSPLIWIVGGILTLIVGFVGGIALSPYRTIADENDDINSDAATIDRLKQRIDALIGTENAEIDRLRLRVNKLEAVCREVHTATEKSKSGTSLMVARKLGEVLREQ